MLHASWMAKQSIVKSWNAHSNTRVPKLCGSSTIILLLTSTSTYLSGKTPCKIETVVLTKTKIRGLQFSFFRVKPKGRTPEIVSRLTEADERGYLLSSEVLFRLKLGQRLDEFWAVAGPKCALGEFIWIIYILFYTWSCMIFHISKESTVLQSTNILKYHCTMLMVIIQLNMPLKANLLILIICWFIWSPTLQNSSFSKNKVCKTIICWDLFIRSERQTNRKQITCKTLHSQGIAMSSTSRCSLLHSWVSK